MGGGVIRTAAKAASFGAFRAPLIDEAVRRASRHRVAALSSATPALDSEVSAAFLSCDKEQAEASAATAVAHWPAWELDDWELAGGREDERFGTPDPPLRQVFGPVPTLEEAKEATSDLKEALEMVYYQTNPVQNSHMGCQTSVPGETSTVSAVPKHVSQMFSLLKGSAEAQVVVASLASDKNVWEAVMKNEKVIDFCRSPPPIVVHATNEDSEESVVENKFSEDSSQVEAEEETSKGSMFTDMVNNFKTKVSEMVSNISDFLHGFLGISLGNSSTGGANRTTSTAEAYTDMAFGASFVALAVATIMVVLLKRG